MKKQIEAMIWKEEDEQKFFETKYSEKNKDD